MGRHGCVVALLLLAGVVGCGGNGRSPVAPSPQSQPQPSSPHTLSGTVRDYAGGPVAGAAMSLSARGSSVVALSTSTDGAGRYAFTGVVGNVAVEADAPGLYNDVRNLSVLTDVSQDLELTPPLMITAGESVTAELHAGPHPSICSVFKGSGLLSDTCRAVGVRFDRPGTLKASLDWPDPSGLALTQRVSGLFGLPASGPTACCAPGTVLSLPVPAADTVTLLVRFSDPLIAPVTFTLRTSEDP